MPFASQTIRQVTYMRQEAGCRLGWWSIGVSTRSRWWLQKARFHSRIWGVSRALQFLEDGIHVSKITVNLQLELWNQNVFLQINFSLSRWTPTKFEAKVLSKMHVILWGLILGLARGLHTCEWCKHSRWEMASPIKVYYNWF